MDASDSREPPASFDVFLCHNSQDKKAVSSIARHLQQRGLRPWLDVWELRPGLPWQRALEQQIRQIRAAAVCVGTQGRGPWQDLELEAFVRRFVKRSCPVIPVILPDCTEVPELPVFLEGMTWVDFRQDSPDPLDQLVWGITGRKPEGSKREARLVVHREDDTFRARWIEPGGRESETFELTLPLAAEDTADLHWYLEEFPKFVGTGDRVRAGEIEAKIEQWGRALFDAVLGGDEGTHVYRSLMDGVRAGQPAMLTLAAAESEVDPEPLVQPWEMMRDQSGPLVFQGVTIRRQLEGTGQARQLDLARPLRVLMIISRPRDAGFIDPRTSIAPVLDALDALPPGQVTVDFCEPPTLPRLEEMIAEARKKRPFHIVHFDGHGTYLPKTGIGALAFESSESDDKTHLVTGRHLGDLLVRLEVPLVLLEACRSSALSDRPVFGSVAPALVASGVGSVIAFSHSVHIEAARLLVERFYKELADGLTVGQALEEARARLRAEPKRWLSLGPNPETIDLQDWFIPQLYQVGADPALVSHDAGATAPEPAPSPRTRTKNLHGFPPPPMYRFHGRAMELLELERAFRRVPAVLLTGMGGMGKTALAREAADWWLRTRRFEAAVFHSFEQKAGADRVVQVLGQALDGEDFSSRPAEEQWTAAVDLFRERRVFLVWDNFESTLPMYQRAMYQRNDGQRGEDGDSPLRFGSEERQRLRKLYRELTEGNPAGRLLVTCRPQETGLPGIKENRLEGLARPDSLHLLSAVLYQKDVSTDRKGYERQAIDDLLKALDDHPLSIALVAPHLKALTPSEILGELRERLERFADASAEEARNRSLLASLAFSTRRLSDEARGVLPYLAWFEGGVFERNLTRFAELDDEAWETIRGELVATALIRVEEPEWATMPFLRFHPTLPYAAGLSGRPASGESPPGEAPSGEPDAGVGDVEAAETRFIGIYLNVMQAVHQALHGAQPAAGMALLALEEANFRSALRRAFRRGARQEGAGMAGTLGKYLERAGRLRERDDFVAWVRSQLPEDAGLDGATWQATLQHALGLLSQGRADEAVATVQGLIARLEAEGLAGGEDPAFQIATSYAHLGQIYVLANRPDIALEPSQRAIALLEGLPGDDAKGNLSAALGDLANAHRALGQLNEALAAAERALAIDRDLGRGREIAVSLGRIAETLSNQQRYAEADARYTEALDAARAAGDLGLQGTFLQHQAGMQREMGNPGRAVELYKKALTLFQQAGDTEGEMQICDSLGSAERQLGHLDAAEAWYARSRELAEKRNDRYQLSAIAQNVGILHQTRAEQADDPEARAVHLRRAVSSIEESLAIKLGINDQIGAAASYQGLGVLHLMLGELDRAEEYLQQGLGIYEALNLPEVYLFYATLTQVARDRGDDEAAAEWQTKRDAKVAELQRLRRGGDDAPAGVPAQLVDAVLALARVVHEARVRGSALPVDASEALAQLAGLPPPLGAVGSFLREVAGGGTLPSVPEGLPPALGEVLGGLVASLEG